MHTSETIRPQQTGEHFPSARGLGRLQSCQFQSSTSTVLLFAERAKLALRFISEEIVRIIMFECEEPDWSTTEAIVTTESGTAPSLELNETDEFVTITGSKCQVIFHKQTMEFRLQQLGGTLTTGKHTIDWEDKNIRCIGWLEPTSKLYGLGETTGELDKRGERYTMWNSDVFDPHVPEIESLYQSIPFLIHFDRGISYGLFVDNPGRCTYDMRSETNAYKIELYTGKLDMYFIAGADLKQVIRNYTSLTGRIPLPPLWALGYHQSRYSYKSEEEVLQIATKFREKQIPCDAIYLDIHYMDEYRVFTFDKQRFPNPGRMMEKLRQLGFHVVPIVDPGVKKDPSFVVYQEGVRKGYFCKYLEGELFTGEVWPGESVFPDFTDVEASAWWGELHRFYTDMGISGIWNDMNEPSVFNDSKTMDLDVVHANGGNPRTHGEIHNLYGLMMSKATYSGLIKLLDGKRPFVLTRAGYAGIQRYAAVWTGDNRSYWEHLAMSMQMMMNLGLSGIPFCGADIGGFGHHATGELLVRWTQMGTFSPYCRNHSLDGTRYQEPWQFGEEVEDICRQYIGLRYRWLPYLYTLFYEASQTGIPIIRPLFLEYLQDERTYSISDQFMVGSQVMVAPIYRAGTTHRAVYFPEGSWIDYWTHEEMIGGQYHLVDAPLSKMPIYVKSGAIIAQTDVVQSTMNSDVREITFHIYANEAGESRCEFYEDDGTTVRYQQGAYNLFSIERKQDHEFCSIEIKQEAAGFPDCKRQFVFLIKKLPYHATKVTGLDELYDSWYRNSNGDVIVRTTQPRSMYIQVM